MWDHECGSGLCPDCAQPRAKILPVAAKRHHLAPHESQSLQAVASHAPGRARRGFCHPLTRPGILGA
jgi:hypothetical protein